MKFRRNTHTRDGKVREELSDDKLNCWQKAVWVAHGDIVHMLDSAKAMSYEDILNEIRSDSTNYGYHPYDLQALWQEGSALPSPERVALSLVRCIEAGFVEVVNE